MPSSLPVFLRSHRAEARHAARVMVGCAATYLLDVAFQLPQGYWAVFTTLIVMQASIGGTVGASVDRLYGTILGVAVGCMGAAVRPQTPLGLGVALVICGGLTAYVAMLRPNMKVAPVTAAIMLMTSAGRLGPLHAAAYRVLEIGVGGVIGVASTLLVFPARSRAVVAERTGKVLAMLAELLSHYAEWLDRAEAEPSEALLPLHDRIRAAIGSVEQAVADAERERAARLGYHHLSPATPRTLWRIRSEAVTLGRALRVPWPEELRTRLSASGAKMLRADAAWLLACRSALAAGVTVDRSEAEARHQEQVVAVTALRHERITHDFELETVGAMFSFVFALESLYGHLHDLADRIDEAALERPVRGGTKEKGRT